MKTIGNDVYIQRGEDFTLDLGITNRRGEPYMLSRAWRNPYLAVTITAARYEQRGDLRETYWLDLSSRLIELRDGSVIEEPIKRFTDTIAYPLSVFSIVDVISIYGQGAGGKMVLDKSSDNDVMNFLFFTVDEDGTRVFKYLAGYTLTGDAGELTDYEEVWKEYSFNIVKSFDTSNWVEQKYLYDAKILAGDTIDERIAAVLNQEDKSVPAQPWTDEQRLSLVESLDSVEEKENILYAIEEGTPLVQDYDTKVIILDPSNLFVSTNIQGGLR